MPMQSKTTNSKVQKSLDTLDLQLTIQSKAIRMSLKERKEARRLMKTIFKTDIK